MIAVRRGLLVPALAVALLLAAALAAYLFVRYDKFESSDRSRSTVVATAEQFALRMDATNGADPKAYTERILEMLTTKAKKTFEQQFEAIQKLQNDPELKGTGKVYASGIASLDPDSATVLVVHDSATNGSSGEPTVRHHRWVVELERVSGKWLVDDFSPVA